jgi:hypothetical protein
MEKRFWGERKALAKRLSKIFENRDVCAPSFWGGGACPLQVLWK